jgi:hypothetical protein
MQIKLNMWAVCAVKIKAADYISNDDDEDNIKETGCSC